jgi:hypothetical protein
VSDTPRAQYCSALQQALYQLRKAAVFAELRNQTSCADDCLELYREAARLLEDDYLNQKHRSYAGTLP